MRRLLFVLFVLVATGASAQRAQLTPLVVETTGGPRPFSVELADTPQTRARGLMFRTRLEEGHGMLFDFGEERLVSFWMKNTVIPLDMIFIDSSGEITHIHANARPGDLTAIPSNGPVQAVLEIRGGLARILDIQPGDTVRHEIFGNYP